jgi:hypothetical protein
MTDKSRALHGKLSYCKRLVVAKNTAALPSWVDFLDENDKNEPSIVPESKIVQSLEESMAAITFMHANVDRRSRCSKGVNFHHFLRMVSLRLKSRTILRIFD